MNKSHADQTPETLESISDRLIALGGSMRATATMMRMARVNRMTVKNFSALTAGMKKIVSFNKAAENALQDAQEERGDFSAAPPSITVDGGRARKPGKGGKK